MSVVVNPRKVAVVGCGMVGSASAFALMQSGLFSEMALIDANLSRAQGEALDIAHGLPFAAPMNIYAGTYSSITDAGVVVIAAGMGRGPNETRLDLINKNVAVFREVVPQIMSSGFAGILLVVSNPVDILTYVTMKLSGLPANRVMGTGTVLDTARFKCTLGEWLGVDPRNVHARILGEHGDGEFPAWSLANVSGISLEDFCAEHGVVFDEALKQEISDDVKYMGKRIIEKKRVTNYGVAMTVKRICEAIGRDEKSILPVSHYMAGQFGLPEVSLSMPAVIGKDGVEYTVPIRINAQEQAQLQASAAELHGIIESLGL